MAEIEVITVKRSQEESARGGVFWDVDLRHGQADSKAWPEGEVFIADDKTHAVAKTYGVSQAISHGRLVQVGKAKTVEIGGSEIDATDAARALAEEAGVDLAEIPPTGKDGQVTKGDVQGYIRDHAPEAE